METVAHYICSATLDPVGFHIQIECLCEWTAQGDLSAVCEEYYNHRMEVMCDDILHTRDDRPTEPDRELPDTPA